MRDDGLNSFDTNQSRSEVNFQVQAEKPDCALVQPTKGHTMLQLDGTCATEVVAGELVEGFEFEPRCLVVVSALENEKALFDAMMSAGRLLTDPFVSRVRNSNLCPYPHRHPTPLLHAGNTSELYNRHGLRPRRQDREHQLPQQPRAAA